MSKELFSAWLEAKAAEKAATEKRLEVERAILDIHPAPSEGQVTFKVSGFKTTIKQDIKRVLDDKKYSMVRDSIPEQLRPVEVIEEFKLDIKGLKWLKDNEPGYFKLMAQCVTEKPSKPSISIERIIEQ